MVWIGIMLIVMMAVLFITAVEKVKYGEFSESVWWLLSFGIYEWGQALPLTVFWILYGLACLAWWTPNQALYVYILFHIGRAIVELLLLTDKHYQGLSFLTIMHEDKMSAEQRRQLLWLSQGVVLVMATVMLQYIPFH